MVEHRSRSGATEDNTRRLSYHSSNGVASKKTEPNAQAVEIAFPTLRQQENTMRQTK